MKTNGVTIKPSFIHSHGKLKSTEKLTLISAVKKAPACNGVISPVVSGLALVRSTCLSMSLSAKSLMMQPALLHERAPKVKRPTVVRDGIIVGELSARPQKQGSSSNYVPI